MVYGGQIMTRITSPSHYQQAIFDHLVTSSKPLIIEATAGSGKTSTITEACHRIAPRTALIVAFNKTVADTLTSRLPKNAKAKTLHSFGLAAWKRLRPDVQVNARKLDVLAEADVKANRLPQHLAFKVTKLTRLARTHGLVPHVPAQHADALKHPYTENEQEPLAAAFGTLPLDSILPDTIDAWTELGKRFDVFGSTPPVTIVPHARRLLHTAIFYAHVIDYDDMIYMPTLTQATKWTVDADVLMVDELQDLDNLQRRLIAKLAKQAQFVGVGDSRQAIYSFRGAGSHNGQTAIELLADELGAEKLPLSICYRCPTSHLDLARWVEPRIEARPGAPTGTLLRYGDDGTLACAMPEKHGFSCTCCAQDGDAPITDPVHFQPGDVVVSRPKAPLIKLAYWLLRHDVPCMILGRDIAQELHSYLVSHVRYGESVPPNVLADRVKASTAKLIAKLEDEDEITELTDRRDVLVSVLLRHGSVDRAIDSLNSLFGTERRMDAVCLSTIHKFKGGEADRVWWLDYHKPCLESPMLRHPWQRREAENLRFVASTRSRDFLGLIKSKSFSG